MQNLKPINVDTFFICERLKEIDPSYQVYLNNQGKYEVHSNAQLKSSYCFTVPYSQLDGRTLQYALKTASIRRDEIIKEIERNNQLLYEKEIKNQVNLLKEALC